MTDSPAQGPNRPRDDSRSSQSSPIPPEQQRSQPSYRHLWESTSAITGSTPLDSAAQTVSASQDAHQQLPAAGWYPNPSAPGLRWWDGVTWTNAYLPPNPSPPASLTLASTLRRHRWPIAAGTVVAVIAIAFAINMNARDEPSYQAGHEYGTEQGSMYTALTADSATDANLDVRCVMAAAIAVDNGVYWSGGRLEGEDINEDDYKDGCFDAYRGIAPR